MPCGRTVFHPTVPWCLPLLLCFFCQYWQGSGGLSVTAGEHLVTGGTTPDPGQGFRGFNPECAVSAVDDIPTAIYQTSAGRHAGNSPAADSRADRRGFPR